MSTRSTPLMAAAISQAIAGHAAPARSLEVKLESQTVVDVLAAEIVGRLPDESVANALQRVSGVSIAREFGKGESVSIRASTT